MKKVWLVRHNQWADILLEDDRFIWAIDPVDGMTTYVDKSQEHFVRPEDTPESHYEGL
jgi:hypothetical protein